MKKNKLGKKKLFHIADRVLNKPLYVSRDYAKSMLGFFGGRGGFSSIVTADEIIAIKHAATSPEERYQFEANRGQTWQLRPDGTAVLPISGSLSHDGAGGGMMSSMGRGYNSIISDAKGIAAHPGVERVAMINGSNGGEVSGCSTCAETIYKVMQDAGLTMWSFADENSHSASYWQSAAADKIVLPSSGEVGSVGTVMTHASYEEAYKREGIQITMIHAGDKKVVGNPYENLSDKDYEELNKEIQYFGNLFRQGVNALRPSLSLGALEDAQAGTFAGQEAVDAGFADEVLNIDEFYQSFAEEVQRDNSKTISIGNIRMDKNELEALEAKAAQADKYAEELKQAKADAQAQVDAAKASATRFKDVLASAEAQAAPDEALEMLQDDDFASFSAEKIIKQLAKIAPKEAAKEPVVEEEELHPDAQALLRKAKENSTDTKGIEALGESKDVSPNNNKDDKEKEQEEKEKYSASVETDPTQRLNSFLASAKIVRANLARSTI